MCTIANATSGWIPTITVSAPRSSTMCAMSRSVPVANESMTSSAVTSMLPPRERGRPTFSTRASRRCTMSASVSADWMMAMRYGPCLRIGTSKKGSFAGASRPASGLGLGDRDHLVAEQALGFFDAALQVAHRPHLSEVDADVHQRLRDLGRQTRHDHARAEQPGRLHGEHQVVGHVGVHGRHAGNVDDHDAGAGVADSAQELLGELARPVGIDDADDRLDEQPLAHLEDRRGQLADGLLLLPDDPLALAHEPHCDGDGDRVGRRLVGVERAVEERRVVVVLGEQRPRQHVAQQQHDSHHLVGLHPPRDDAFGEILRVRFERLEGARLEGIDVAVVDGGGLGEQLVLGHGGEELRVVDAAHPLLTELRPVFGQVGDDVAQRDVGGPFRVFLESSESHGVSSSNRTRPCPPGWYSPPLFEGRYSVKTRLQSKRFRCVRATSRLPLGSAWPPCGLRRPAMRLRHFAHLIGLLAAAGSTCQPSPARAQHPNVRVSSPGSTNPEEVTIAVDPTHQLHLAAGANISYSYYSFDGGLGWTEGVLSSSLGVAADPVVLYDEHGYLYYGHLSISSTGDWLDRIVVQRSSTGGMTWNDGAGVGLDPPRDQDKPGLAVDRTGSPYRDRLYLAWTEFDSYGSAQGQDSSRILFSHSVDLGITWSPPVRVNDVAGDCQDGDNTVEGAVPAVGPQGQVYLAWSGPGGHLFDRSLDGGASWGRDVPVAAQPGGWDFAVSGISRCNGLPTTLCDSGNSPYRGFVYVVWSDQRVGADNTDVFLSRSTDGGLTC